MEKVKEVIAKVTHKDDTARSGTHDPTHTGTTGSHATGTHPTGTHTGTTGAGHSTTAGPHGSNMANKADPRVDSDMDGGRNMGAAQHGPGAHQTHGTTGSGLPGQHGTGMAGQHDTAGPYSSNMANKADPRVDSDMDGSRNFGAAQHGAGAHQTGSGIGSGTNPGLTGQGTHNTVTGAGSHNTGSGMTGSTGTHGTSTTDGPHNSNMLNKMDPRVDSDRDGGKNMGAAQYGSGAHQTGSTGFGSGTTGSGMTGSHGSSNAGPHNTNAGNALDPRVDSDRDGSRNMGTSQYGPGSHNTGSSGYSHGTHAGSGLTGTTGSTNTGPYDSNMANKADPRVDSDRDGSRNMGASQHGPGAHQPHGTAGGLHSGPGPAPNTAGPHKSDMLNKMDPRIDSDQNGSKTVGKAPPTY